MSQQNLSDRERLAARPNSNCYVCGIDNPHGLHLVFGADQNGGTSATWTPDSTLEGFSGIVHGGIVSTALDESMAKAVTAMGFEALTAELKVRFRRHVSAGKQYRVRGWVEERDRRVIKAEASLSDLAGAELAHAWASFLVLK
jgi:acyl-coenzyme A thioesterase PaaI-like protein